MNMYEKCVDVTKRTGYSIEFEYDRAFNNLFVTMHNKTLGCHTHRVMPASDIPDAGPIGEYGICTVLDLMVRELDEYSFNIWKERIQTT